jgi:hypothetical protein
MCEEGVEVAWTDNVVEVLDVVLLLELGIPAPGLVPFQITTQDFVLRAFGTWSQ